MTPSYVDSHCHLDDAQFDSDRRAVILRARAAGVLYMLAIGGGSGPATLDAGLRIASFAAQLDNAQADLSRSPAPPEAGAGDSTWIYAAGGIHPHEAANAEEAHYRELRHLARDSRFVAIGEIGLDYHYDHAPRDLQRRVLIRQLEIANEVKLPVIIQCRDAWSDLREVIGTVWGRAPGSALDMIRGILHCFSGTGEDASELMNYGFMVSFAGNITFKKAEELRKIAREIPLDRLLTETDCPYLAPVPYRGKRNEPAYVREVTRELALLHDIPEEVMGQQMADNFRCLLGLNSATRI